MSTNATPSATTSSSGRRSPSRTCASFHPGEGICHQLNIEKFAHVVMQSPSGAVGADGSPTVYFDTLVGTDSHTPTANGIGVLGWGVGGIEAEAAALGQPITTLVPQVIGVKLTGKLAEGVSAMDVSLTFASMLRERGVVGCFVECFGEGVSSLSATQRACVSNMTPEYGCTCTLFPVDDNTPEYLRLTGAARSRWRWWRRMRRRRACGAILPPRSEWLRRRDRARPLHGQAFGGGSFASS